MTSLAVSGAGRRTVSRNPARIDYALAAGATLVLAGTVTAVVRGRAEWGEIPWPVWGHLATIIGALALTPVMLMRRRGDRPHKILGRIWIAFMVSAAALSFGIRGFNHGGLGPIHLLSAFVIVMAPLAGWYAHRGNPRGHQIAVRGIITGALLIAGAFTFPFGRLLGHWLFG